MLGRAWRSWCGFFFERRSATALALVRIALGVVLLINAFGLAADAETWFAAGGLSPFAEGASRFTIFEISTSPGFVRAVIGTFLIAGACVTLGFFTRTATFVAYGLLLSFWHRNPYIMNSGDLMLRLMIGLLCLAPAGAALSVDRWRSDPKSFWEPRSVSAWALRLMQIQLCVIYLSTIWQKLRGQTWLRGDAMYYGFVQLDLVRLPLPTAFVQSAPVMMAITWGLLATEISLGVLVWVRRARPWVLGAGAVMHASGHVFLLLSIFSFVVLGTYLTFLDPDWCDERIAAFRRKRRRRDEMGPAIPS